MFYFAKWSDFPCYTAITHSWRTLRRLPQSLDVALFKTNPQASTVIKNRVQSLQKSSSEGTEKEPTTSRKKEATFSRQNPDSYLKYGFITIGDSNAQSAYST